MENNEVKIFNNSQFDNPKYATEGASGMDLRANIETPVSIAPMERVVIPTGLHFEIPFGMELQIRPRSGLAVKHGITVLNSPGTLDSDFRGECKVILINFSSDEFIITPGERIAQAIVSRYEKIQWKNVENLENLSVTHRGEAGFGSTGTK